MMERFARRSRTVVVRAREEAVREGSGTVEAEHLLLALADGEASSARRVLLDVGLDGDAVRGALEREHERSLAAVGVAAEAFDLPPATRFGGEPRWSTSAKLAMERALHAAQARSDRSIEPLHLLLGVLAAPAGRVPRALEAAGVDRTALFDAARAAA